MSFSTTAFVKSPISFSCLFMVLGATTVSTHDDMSIVVYLGDSETLVEVSFADDTTETNET